jgi:hypothetical protein
MKEMSKTFVKVLEGDCLTYLNEGHIVISISLFLTLHIGKGRITDSLMTINPKRSIGLG